MRLLIIRHGESEADLLDAHEGRADFALTPRGHAQAEAMAAWVAARYSLSRLVCSPLRRARQTAEHLARRTGLPLCENEKLMEFNNGLLAGLERKAAEERYPDVPDLPPHEARYGQESMLEFRFRAEYALSQLLAESGADDTVAVVTHGGMIQQLYRAFLGLPLDSHTFWLTGDTGLHEWVVRPDGKRVVRANSLAHLEGLAI